MTTAPRPRLSRSRVLDAALLLADREGAEALTVRRLADDLGVHPTSLYNHLPSKGAILDGVVERLFAEVAVPSADVAWQDWVRLLAASLRDVARAHPGAFMVLTRRPAETPAALVLSETGLAAFRRGGFSLLEGLQAVRAVSLAVLGLALNECPPMGDWVDPSPGDLYDDHPALAEAAALVRPEDESGHWDLLVEALVAGLRPR
ncbi:MAG: hypothetical protein JWO60_596 [Frankiales bacterium]|nr:hypothetical protein [Frankiales bacterium]